MYLIQADMLMFIEIPPEIPKLINQKNSTINQTVHEYFLNRESCAYILTHKCVGTCVYYHSVSEWNKGDNTIRDSQLVCDPK